MICWVSSIDEMIRRLQSFKEAGASHVGVRHPDQDDTPFLDQAQLELVYIDRDGVIVGDEANGYRPRPEDWTAVMIT